MYWTCEMLLARASSNRYFDCHMSIDKWLILRALSVCTGAGFVEYVSDLMKHTR